MQVSHCLASNIEDIDLLALAIKKTENDNTHTGIFYKKKRTGPTFLCHLIAHFKLSDDPASGKLEYKWLNCDLNKSVKLSLAALVTNIVRQHEGGQKIPYGCLNYGHSFDKNGVYQKTAPGDGLTCATFVLDIFSSQGLEIIDQGTWPVRQQEDEAFKAWVVAALNANANCDPRHRDAMAAAEVAPRYKPPEVGVGFQTPSKQWPVTFEQVEPFVAELMEAL